MKERQHRSPNQNTGNNNQLTGNNQNGGLSSQSISSRIRQTGTGTANVPSASGISTSGNGGHLSSGGVAGENAFEKQFMKTLQKVYQTIERNEMRLAEQDRRDVIKNDWQQVGLVVDRCLLGLFVIITLTITISLMTSPPQGWVFFMGRSKPGVGEA